jgi:hypothetical protein
MTCKLPRVSSRCLPPHKWPHLAWPWLHIWGPLVLAQLARQFPLTFWLPPATARSVSQPHTSIQL